MEWQGLAVDWHTATATFAGREVEGLSPMAARFLHIMLSAQGGRVRTGQFDALLGEVTPNCRSVHVAHLRRAMRLNALPFEIPKTSEGRGYRLVSRQLLGDAA